MENIKYILQNLEFIRTDGKSGKYDIWTSPKDSELWVAIPKERDSSQMDYFNNILAETLLYHLNLKQTEENKNELLSQLVDLNYKMFNKISLNEQNYISSVPYELAQVVTLRNITGFRTYLHQFSQKLSDIPIERFKLNHTKKGSFIIPISILCEKEDSPLPTFPTELSKMVRGYLDKISMIKDLNTKDVQKFAKDAFEREISSTILEDIIGFKDSIASTTEKYKSQLKEVQIFSNGNPILDFNISETDKSYKTVDLFNLNPLPEEYFNTLVNLETKQNETLLEAHGVDMYVEVDSINITGTAMFNVYGVDNKILEKPFKAQTVKLSKERIDLCADALKTRAKIKIKGDITKKKKKIGEVVVDEITNDDHISTPKLFNIEY